MKEECIFFDERVFKIPFLFCAGQTIIIQEHKRIYALVEEN